MPLDPVGLLFTAIVCFTLWITITACAVILAERWDRNSGAWGVGCFFYPPAILPLMRLGRRVAKQERENGQAPAAPHNMVEPHLFGGM